MANNLELVRQLNIEPKAKVLLDNRLPLMLVVAASIAISLRKLAKDKDDD